MSDIEDAPADDATLPTKAAAKVSLAHVADEGAFRAARPRLVIADEALTRVVPVDAYEFEIGRSTRRDLNLVLDHDGISSSHARIEFAGRRFFLVDLDSSNHTFLGEEQLAPRAPREITSDARIRFGTIDTLFVTDVDASGNPPPRQRYRAALALLARQGRITRRERAHAAEEADRRGLNPAEVLIAARLIGPQDWVEALDQARVLSVILSFVSERWVLYAALGLALALALAAAVF